MSTLPSLAALKLLPLGKLTKPIVQAEIDAAAHTAWKHGFDAAHLITVEGGDLYIHAKPPGEPGTLLVPAPKQSPVAPRCHAPAPAPRAALMGRHPFDTTRP